MSITQEEVGKLAQLARLSIKPEELPKIAEDLAKVLGYVAKLQAISTNDEIINKVDSVRLRPDEVIEFPDMSSLIKAAPEHEGNMITVPPIFANRV